MNETKAIEGKLNDAREAVARMTAELTKTTGELENLDVTTGDVDKIVDSQIRLAGKKKIIETRLQLAGAHVQELEGDLLIETARAAKEQANAVKAKLEAAKSKVRAALVKLTGRGAGLQPHEISIINSMADMCAEVRPLIVEEERSRLLAGDAEARASETARKRLMAESREAAKMQEAVFAGNV